jgi:uncharacterized protein
MYVYNKIDTITIEEVDKLAREPHSVVISVHAKLNLDYMLAKMWEHLKYPMSRCGNFRLNL